MIRRRLGKLGGKRKGNACGQGAGSAGLSLTLYFYSAILENEKTPKTEVLVTNFTYSPAALQRLEASDPDVFAALMREEVRQSEGIELIPSENYCFPEVYALLGSVFNNKYSEGYPGRRYYGGQENTDVIETLARDRAKALFRAEHANVQPMSGSAMNQAVYFALLQPGDTVLAMDLTHGGHLTHGAPVSHMGKIFKFLRYKTEYPSGKIDMDKLGFRVRCHVFDHA